MSRTVTAVVHLALLATLAAAPAALADAPDGAIEAVLEDSEPLTIEVPRGKSSRLIFVSADQGRGMAMKGGPAWLQVWSDGSAVATPPRDAEPASMAMIRSSFPRFGRDLIFRTVVQIRVVDADQPVRVVKGVSRPPVASAPAPPPASPEPTPVELEPPSGRSRGADGNSLIFAWGAAEGAWLGGTFGYAIGDATSGGDNNGRSTGAAVGALVGTGAGLGTVALLQAVRPDWEIDGNEVATLSSMSTLGGFTGLQLGRAVVNPKDEDARRRIALAGALGSIAGTGVGIAAMSRAPAAKVMLNADFGALIGWQAAAGMSDMLEWTDPEEQRARAGLALGGAAILGTTAGVLRAAGAKAPNAGLTALDLGHGAWLGTWAPFMVNNTPDATQIAGGLRLGLGAGYLLAQAMAPAVRPDARSVTLQVVGLAAGNALGAGIPMAMGVDPFGSDASTRTVVGPMLGAGVAGQLLGAAVAPHYDLSKNDAALITMLGGWTAYNAVGWGIHAQAVSEDAHVHWGYAMTAAGSGTLLATALAPLIDIEPAESVLAVSAGGWGTFFGAWVGHLTDLNPNQRWALTLGMGNAALLGTASLATGPIRADWLDVGFIDGVGIVGGATGALVGLIASPDVDPVAWGAIGGAAAGLGLGIYLAAKPGKSMVSDVLPEIPIDLGFDVAFDVRPWTSPDGSPGVFAEVDLTQRIPR